MKHYYMGWLVILTLASRLTLKQLFHLEFDTTQIWIGWQLIDPQLLKHHLLQSIWYLHSQPPLYNLFLGIILKFFPLHYAAVLEWSYLLLGMLQSLVLYRSLCLLTNWPRLSFGVALVFAVSPCFVLYEHWFFYTFPGMCMLSISVYPLLKFLQSRRWIWGFAFFMLLGILALTISMFHLLWLVMVVAGLLVMEKNMARKVILAAALPLLLVSAWYLKNLVVFGSFSATSWFGMNISRIMLLPAQELQLNTLQLDNVTLQVVYEGPFRPMIRYKPHIQLYNGPWAQVAVLQQECNSNGYDNFNNINYMQVSARFRQAAIRSLQHRPGHYLHYVLIANTLYFSPASDYFHLEKNRKRINSYNALFNLGDIRIRKGYIGLMNILLGGMTAVVLSCSMLICIRQQSSYTKRHLIIIAYALFNILFVGGAGNFLEIGENMRFRFMTIPLFLVLATTLYQKWLHGCLVRFFQNAVTLI